jgi:replication-associated recombination protein RarA
MATKTKSWILFGPPASGKTRHGEQIAKSLGLTSVHEWDGTQGDFKPFDTLNIVNYVPKNFMFSRRAISIDQAMRRISNG